MALSSPAEDAKKELLSNVRLEKLSVEEALSFLNYCGISIQKYKKIKDFLNQKGTKIFPSETKVSTLQAKKFRELSLNFKAVAMKSLDGAVLSVPEVMTKLEAILGKIGIPMEECQFVCRIDGRPNELHFEVLIGLSIIHKGREIPGGCSCIPLGLYEGEETFRLLEANALPVLKNVRRWIGVRLGHTSELYLGADLSLFWTLCETNGVCPKCAATIPASRFANCGGNMLLNAKNPFVFWIQQFVPCILHMKMRIFSHFIEQIYRSCHGSTYWYKCFRDVLKSISLRWQVYEDQDYPEKARIPSYKGNEIDKIMLNLEIIIKGSVANDRRILQDWTHKNLVQIWKLEEKFAKYDPGADAPCRPHRHLNNNYSQKFSIFYGKTLNMLLPMNRSICSIWATLRI